MYDLLDRPVADLPVLERGLLDRTRAWVHMLTLAGTAPPPVKPADEPFDAAMRTLDRGSIDTLVFQRPCHATVEETEAVWLSLWRLVRADRIAAARSAVTGLVSAESADALVAAMTRAAAHA